MKNIIVKILGQEQAGTKYIAIPQKEYQAFRKHQMEVTDALKKIKRGNTALKRSNAKTIKSVAELMS